MTSAEFIVELVESFKVGRRRYVLAFITTVFGVFLLTLLTGAGFSISRGINVTYGYAEKNLVRISPGITSVPYEGLGKNRRITLEDADVRLLGSRFPRQVRDVVPVSAGMGSVSVGDRNFPSRIYGVKPGYMDALFLVLCHGRDISAYDTESRSRNCLIPKTMAECYFSRSNPESAISQYIEIDGTQFRIVGIFKGLRNSDDSGFIILPGSTASTLCNMDENYQTVILNLYGMHSKSENEDFKANVRRILAQENSFAPDDRSAVAISDNFTAFRQMSSILSGMRKSIVLFCILILISGIFGVSNILFISVKERTYEFVLRRLMGASDAHIFSLVVFESVIVMVSSAIVGMLLAEGALFILDSVVAPTRSEDYYIWGAFNIDFSILITIILSTVVSGIIAGLAPAKKAVGLEITEVH